MAWIVDGLSYTTRKKLTIDETKIDTANLTNFPVLVKLTDDAQIGVGANADGFDIRFTSSDGITLLKYERESWAVAAGVCNACFWVKIPTVKYDANTEFYIYYRTTDTADGADPTNVWDTNFKAVYHLKDITTSTVADSTGVNLGTKGAANLPLEVNAKIGKGQRWDGANREITVADSVSLRPAALTLEMWIKPTGTHADYGGMLEKYWGGSPTWASYIFRWHDEAGGDHRLYFDVGKTGGYSSVKSTTTAFNDVWSYVVGTYDGTNIKLYINGAWEATTVEALTIIYTDGTLNFGKRGGGADQDYEGDMDEVRISNLVRSDGWIKASYHSGNNTLLTYGSEEAESPYMKQPLEADSYNREDAYNSNYGGLTWIVANTLINGVRRLLLYADISDFTGSSANITSAKLKMYYYDNGGGDPVGLTLWAYKLTRPTWTELGNTWNKYDGTNAWTLAGGDWVTSSPSGGSAVMPASYGWVEWDVTNIVKDAMDNVSKHVHILLKWANEDVGDKAAFFYAKEEATQTNYRPVLEINYDLAVFNGVETNPADICEISSDHAVITYSYYDVDGWYLFARICEHDGSGGMTFGPAYKVFTASSNAQSIAGVAKLNTDKFVIASACGDNIEGSYRVGTRQSDNTITWGTVQTNESAMTEASLNLCPLGTDKFLSIWQEYSTAYIHFQVNTVSGTTITFGTAVQETNQGYMSLNYGSLAQLTTDKAVTCHRNLDGGSFYSYAQVVTVSGTTPTYGALYQYPANASVNTQQDICCPSTSNFVICFRDGGDSNHGKLIAGTVSGTTITLGTEVEFLAAAITLPRIGIIDSTHVVFFYKDASNHSQIGIATVSGNTISNVTASQVETSTSNNAYMNIINQVLNHYVFAIYKDAGNSSYGTIYSREELTTETKEVKETLRGRIEKTNTNKETLKGRMKKTQTVYL